MTVGANGGIIDAGGFDISIDADVKDSGDIAGRMYFIGGGSIALMRAVGWTGGTTLEAGTSLGVTTENKDEILNDLTVVIPAEGAADDSVVLANISDEGFFTQSEVDSIKLTGTQDGRYSIVLGESGKSIVIVDRFSGEYVWNGGASGSSWKADGKWLKNGSVGNWYDSTAAVFVNAGDAVTIDEAVAAASIDFRAGATVSGEGTLSSPEIVVGSSFSATISAPTTGLLKKTGAGTLILSKPRTEDTVLSEGTLVMSGDAATVDPAKLTLGTDVEKPVTFDYGGKTFVKDINISGGLDVTVKNGTFSLERVAVGTLRVAKDTVLNSKEGWACVGPSSSSPDASTSSLLDVCGGRVNINTQDFSIGDFGGAESSSEVWVRKGGSLVTVKDILIGTRAAGTLTIDDGTVATASNMSVVFASNIDCVEGRDCVLNLNEGGVLSTATVRYGSGSAKATIFFNGGTFKSLLNNLALIQQPEKITALVKAGGGVIDANGNTVRIDTPLLEDESSIGGGMTFKGGGVVALASGNTYTGKTTVELG
ncbi:MAG: hypothetical protein IKZ36_03830, partial [Kiritimatiellae bacterium]|nr:hypothetical protein [Kiritimatiellia bacterium]